MVLPTEAEKVLSVVRLEASLGGSTEVPLAHEGELGSCAAPVWDQGRDWWTLRDLVEV